MRSLLGLLYTVILFCPWCTVSVLRASPTITVTQTAPKPNTKLTSATGSTITFRPLADVLSNGLKHPLPSLPPGAAAKKLGGVVELGVETAKSGDVRKVTLARSSGSPLLDEMARTWVQRVWRYPTVGQPETHQARIQFKTTNDDVARQADEASFDRSRYPNTPRPPYLALAIYLGWQGTVRMKLIPNGAGGVKEAQVIATSGTPLLDLISKAWCESYWKLLGNAATDCSITFQLR